MRRARYWKLGTGDSKWRIVQHEVQEQRGTSKWMEEEKIVSFASQVERRGTNKQDIIHRN